jgi:RNA polymerase sigma factor (sigma-70 family)
MPRFDSQNPSTVADESPDHHRAPEQAPTLVTEGGVEVRVEAPSPAAPTREPAPAQPVPDAVVAPRALSKQERDALVRQLYEEHRDFIRMVLSSRQDVKPASVDDLAQEVLIALQQHVDRNNAGPRQPRAFLRSVIRNEVIDHNDLWKPDIQEGADADALLAPEADPEGTAELAERRRKLDRYLPQLPEQKRNVVRCVKLFEMSFAETGQALGIPPGSASRLYYEAESMLADLARKSERATRLGGSL